MGTTPATSSTDSTTTAMMQATLEVTGMVVNLGKGIFCRKS